MITEGLGLVGLAGLIAIGICGLIWLSDYIQERKRRKNKKINPIVMEVHY